MTHRLRPHPYLATLGSRLGQGRDIDPPCAVFPAVAQPAGATPCAPAEVSTASSRKTGAETAVLRQAQDEVTRPCASKAAVTLSERLVAERAEAIGLSPLLGRHFDDLTDLPDFERAGQNRYASGGP
jgi:hypothetical protein